MLALNNVRVATGVNTAVVFAHEPLVPLQVPVEHGVPEDLNASAGHMVRVRGQTSDVSHSPEGGRQMVATRNESAGHAASSPVHISAASKMPATGRQMVPTLN